MKNAFKDVGEPLFVVEILAAGFFVGAADKANLFSFDKSEPVMVKPGGGAVIRYERSNDPDHYVDITISARKFKKKPDD